MGILSSSVISQSNLYARYRIEERLQDLQNKMIALQEYTAAISNSSVGLDAMSKVPASMFGRLLNFTTNADAVATQNAQQKFWLMQQTQGAIPNFNGDYQTQQLYNWQLQNSLFESERKNAIDAETKRLHAEETKIQAEITQLERHKQMIEKQEETESANFKKEAEKIFKA